MASVCHLDLWVHFGTMHKEYLEHNLVGMHSVVFVIWKFEYFACLAGKCLFTPQNFCGGRFHKLNGSSINATPKKPIRAWKDVVWCIDHQNQSTSATCMCDSNHKDKESQLYADGLCNSLYNCTGVILWHFTAFSMKCVFLHCRRWCFIYFKSRVITTRLPATAWWLFYKMHVLH